MTAPNGNKNAKGNKGGGRPSAYKPEYVELAKNYCEQGATDEDLARYFHVTERTINTWKGKYIEFNSALKENKPKADNVVERSLFEKATGYSHPAVHVSNYKGEITVTPFIKHYPPDTTAMIYWLKNRQPNKWRNKQEIEHTHTNKYDDMTDDQLIAEKERLERIASGDNR